MKLTIGMASYNNHAEAWFTVKALHLYQDLTDTEILVIDNFGDDELKNAVNGCASPDIRYVRWTDAKGTAAAKNRIFAEAKGEWVISIDSHVLLPPGAIKRFRDWVTAHPDCRDLLQGPLLYNDNRTTADAFNDEWRGQMWGTWRNTSCPDEADRYEIPMMGMGLFGCRKDAWLGFNTAFRGFGGEEGYIHTKFRQHGRKTLCLPFLKWVHYFRPGNGKGPTPYPVLLKDKVRNYILGFRELGLSLEPVYKEFGLDVVRGIETTIDQTEATLKPVQQAYNDAITGPVYADIKEHIPTLAALGAGKIVTEFGVRNGGSTLGWIHGKPARLTSYDIQATPALTNLNRWAAELGVPFTFIQGDSLQVEIEPTDILMIDSLHTEKQLAAELARHAGKARELIVLHDTHTFGAIGEDGAPGLLPALDAFLASHPEWKREKVYTNNNGLTILKRMA